MLQVSEHEDAGISDDIAPRLVVAIDTEEEFDWSKPHNRASIAVSNAAAQKLAHNRVFDQFGIVPTYFVDYAMASQLEGYEPLRQLLNDGKCRIGAHLHSWVSPPHDEEVSAITSYAGNLPPGLERKKLALLTEEIKKQFGTAPTVYRAGRYGVGPETTAILHDLGYTIDMSVVPKTNLSGEAGPNFISCPDRPYWFGPDSNLLEIPLSVGFVGALHGAWWPLYEATRTPLGMALHIPGIMARLRLLERIQLTPEGITLNEQIRLTRALYARGQRVFSYNYHSPSLVPGLAPYVSSSDELELFLDKMTKYFSFFFNELGGVAATPDDVRSMALGARRGRSHPA